MGIWGSTDSTIAFAILLYLVSRIRCNLKIARHHCDVEDDSFVVSYRNSSLSLFPGDIPGNVTHLDLSENSIKSVPSGVLRPLVSLISLNLSGNILNHVDEESVAGPSVLVCLDLSMNTISNVSQHAFGQMTNMRFLSLAGNNLSCWDFISLIDIGSPVGSILKHLDLSHNNIASVNGLTITSTQLRLEILRLNNNQIEYVDAQTFRGLSFLKQLNLDYNRLASIGDGSLKGLSLLQQLFLGSNLLESEHLGAFVNISESLELLSLDSSGNLITVPETFSASVAKVRVVYLRNLTLMCDCNVRWLRVAEISNSQPKYILTNTTCMGTTPFEDGRFLTSVLPSDMVCDPPSVIASRIYFSPEDVALLQVNVTNYGITNVTWTLPFGVVIETDDYRFPDANETLVMFTTEVISGILICRLNISRPTDLFWGQYRLTATNMAGNVTEVLHLDSFGIWTAISLDTKLTVALASLLAVVTLVIIVCFINISHTNEALAKGEGLLYIDGGPFDKKTDSLKEGSSEQRSSEDVDHHTGAPRHDTESVHMEMITFEQHNLSYEED